MVRYALDASAVLRYLDGEAGSDRVAEIIKSHLARTCQAIISAVHWGESPARPAKFMVGLPWIWL
jgi:PIN domain nuclease of toxin-antitoxin system